MRYNHVMTQQIPMDQLQTLLQRNLFLSAELKVKILASTPEKQLEIMPLITSIDTKQTALFKKALAKNPHFFADLENGAIHQALAKLIKEEESFRMDEISDAEAQLNQALEEI